MLYFLKCFVPLDGNVQMSVDGGCGVLGGWEKCRKQYKYKTSSRFSERLGGKDRERGLVEALGATMNTQTLAELPKTSILRGKYSKKGAILTVLCEITDLLWFIFVLLPLPSPPSIVCIRP